MPRQIFEELLLDLVEGDAVGLQRDPATQQLIPTKSTATLHHFDYIIRKGSLIDLVFKLESTDPPPRAPRIPPPTALAQVGDEGVFEVEAIRAKRTTAKRTKYLIKWLGFPETASTWEPPSNINRALVAAYEQRPAPAASTARSRASRPSLPNRGQGAARAFLSGAAQRRGGAPTALSMVCGNIHVNLKEPRSFKSMPVFSLTFKVLSMDNTGHIIWPTTFTAQTQAALRAQARALLRKMIADPLNPCDMTMAPALTGTGTSSVWQGAPRRRLVVVQPGGQ